VTPAAGAVWLSALPGAAVGGRADADSLSGGLRPTQITGRRRRPAGLRSHARRVITAQTISDVTSTDHQ
jgi:hypothetical protein